VNELWNNPSNSSQQASNSSIADPSTAATPNKQVVFIDSTVEDYQSLAAGVQAGTEVIILDSTRDGVAQITEVLGSHTNIDSVHIVSHGSPGCLYLGNTQLSLDTFNRYATQLQQWNVANLLLYGCNLAAGDAGEEFVERLAQLTDAEVYASNALVGSSDLGGTWKLRKAGNDEEQHRVDVFTPATIASYSGVFVTINPTGGTNSTDGLRIQVEPDGDFFITKNSAKQVFNLNGSDTVLAIGTTTYGSDNKYNRNWVSLGQSGVTGAGTSSNPYQVVTSLLADVNSNGVYDPTIDFKLDWTVSYAAFNNFYAQNFTIQAPTGNTQTVKLTQLFDSYLSGTDSGPAYGLDASGTVISGTGGNPKFIGVGRDIGQPNESVMGYIENNAEFSQWYSGSYIAPYGQINNGGNLITTYDTNAGTDNGIAVQYNLGALTGTRSISNFLAFSTTAINNLVTNNEAPALTGTKATLVAGTEDTVYTISQTDLLAGFTDVDADTLSVSNLIASNGTLVNNNNGTWSFTPAANYNGAVNLSYNVTDGKGGSTAASQSFTLAAVNDAPTLTGTKATLAAGSEDTVYTISQTDLLAGFTDVDADTLSAADLIASNGTLVNNNNGTWSFTPAANYNGAVNLSYNVTDGKGGITAATQSFTLAAVNDVPTLTGTKAILAAGSEDTVYSINQTELLAGFTDVEGNPLSVSNLAASNGTLVNNNNGTWSFTPAANYNGAVNLTYNVTDGNGGITAATQSFTLAAVNDAPTLTGTKASLVAGSEDTVYSISQTHLLAGFTDVEGNPLSVANLAASNGTLVNNNNGTWSFTPAANYNGAVNLSYNVTDGKGGSTAATQSFTLAAVNDAPTLNLLTNPGAETGNMSGWNILQNGGNGWAVQTGGYEDSQTFVTSYDWGKRSQTVDLVAKGYSTTVLDQAPTINISEWFRGIEPNTADKSYLKVELRDAGGNVIASFNSGELTAKSDWQQISHTFANYGAGVRYVYWEDGGKDTEYWAGHYGTQIDGASLTLTVPSNSPPTVLKSFTLAAGTEDTVYTISQTDLLAGFTDVDADTLSVSNLIASNGTLVNNNNGTWSFTPAANYNGAVNLSYNVTDGKGGSTAASQSFTLAAVNDAPTLTGTKATLAAGSEDTVYTISQTDLLAGFTDVDADTLSAADLIASNGTLVNNNNGTWSFTPAANYNGAVNLSYNVTDGKGGITAATQSFTLAAVNDVPTLTGTKAILAAGSEDTVYSINQTELLAGFTDVEGNPLSVSNLAASNGTLVNNNNGTWSFTPAANYNGAVNLTYNVTDGNGGITAATQSFTLAAVNDAPTLTGAKATLAAGSEDTVYTISQTHLLAGFTDVDGNTLAVTNLSASNGSLVNNDDGTWSFTPAANYNGTVNLNYNVTDGNGGSTAATQSFTLAAVNDAPSFTAGKNQVITAGAAQQTISGWATGFSPGPADESSQTIQGYEIVSNSDTSIFAAAPVIDQSGNLTYTPSASVASSTTATIEVKVKDNGGTANGGVDTSPIQKFTITVNPQPTISIGDVTVTEGNSGTANATFTVTLSNPSSETITLKYATANSTASNAATAGSDYTSTGGTLTFAPGVTTQTFNVAVNGDNVDEANESFLVNLSDATNAKITDNQAVGTITDDDTAGFTITPISGNTTEAGGTATFTVKLNSQPTADVTLGLTSSDTTEGKVSTPSLTFTAANWNQAQTVTVTGVDDAEVDGNIAYKIITAAAVSADSNYNGLNPDDVAVINVDNDSFNIINGTNLTDTLVGTARGDRINGFGGHDTISGGLGNDQIYGGDGNDILFGDSQNAIVGGDDLLYGGIGNDRCYGNGGSDNLYGEVGDDQIWGDAGNDRLWGGLGNDILTGGEGRDTFVFARGEGTDTIRDFKVGEDYIGLTGGLSLGQLSITQRSSHTWITDNTNGQTLAILTGVNASTLIANAAGTFTSV
jgi:ketosteroid isomerase-like protein